MTSCPASTNLHTLAVNLAAFQRLLGRRTADGTLVPANPSLIEAAIASGRDHVASIKTMLAEVPYDPLDPWRATVDSLTRAVAEVDGLLDMLEEMLSHLDG